MTPKPVRLYKCKAPGCTVRHEKRRPFETWCSPECGLAIATAKRNNEQRKQAAEQRKAARAERKADLEKLDLSKRRQDLLQEAQDQVNRYVRLRDYHDGCISCDKPANWGGVWHASHWRSVGAASGVRFHLWNIHKACSECNHFKGGNIHDYTPRITAKIGLGRANWLKSQNHVVKYDPDYLRRLKRVFAKRANRLQKRIDR